MDFLGALKLSSDFLQGSKSTICNKIILKFFILYIALTRSGTIVYKWKSCDLLSSSPTVIQTHVSLLFYNTSYTSKHTALYIILLASGHNLQINKYFIDMIKTKCMPWEFFFSRPVRMRGNQTPPPCCPYPNPPFSPIATIRHCPQTLTTPNTLLTNIKPLNVILWSFTDPMIYISRL